MIQDAQVTKRGRTNLESVRHATPTTVEIKSQLPFRIFRPEIYFPNWSVWPLCHHQKLVNQLLHLRQDFIFGWENIFWVVHLPSSARHFSHRLPQNENALPHLLHPNSKSIIAVPCRAYWDLKVIGLIIQVGKSATNIIGITRTTQVGPGQPVVQGDVIRNNSHIFGSIHKDSVPI